jgi:hypothetical protein
VFWSPLTLLWANQSRTAEAPCALNKLIDLYTDCYPVGTHSLASFGLPACRSRSRGVAESRSCAPQRISRRLAAAAIVSNVTRGTLYDDDYAQEYNLTVPCYHSVRATRSTLLAPLSIRACAQP